MARTTVVLLALLLVAACAHVREEDQAAWVGQPVSALEKHPVFLTMQLVRTQASDGTEIWNYVNARNVSSCSGFLGGYGNASSGTYGGVTSFSAYNGFMNCMSNVAACNNIFYVEGGIVQRYTPVGSGGARCRTDARLQPGFKGATNI